MSNVTDALVALKAQLIANLTPTPAVRILHPSYDAATITTALANLPTTPVIVLFQNTHSEITYDKRTFKQGGTKQWNAVILLYLQKSESGPFQVLSDSAASIAAMGRQDPWFDMMASALDADRTLGGTVLSVGDDSALFRAIVGELPWNSNNYWGIQFIVPIKEMR